MAVMAILQDVDKCMRCNGCVVSCKRTWKMKALNPGIHKTAPDQRVIIKSLKRVDMGPFMRYSCWHCVNPPCAAHCPFKAIKKMPNGAVWVDHSLCNPGGTNSVGVKCTYQCTIDCSRGGYPKVGAGSDLYSGSRSNKCTLCYGRAGAGEDLVASMGTPLPTKATDAEVVAVPQKAHQPSCVFTCPAKAMNWDTVTNIRAYINDAANGFISAYGDGSMYWASRKFLLIAPKADPFVEDHLTPLVSNLVSGPFAKAALVPTLLAGGLMAVIARRQHLANETMGEV
ncbi:MAG: 4Fe-4S dicluster domain-containing protein [Coriobacteriia bacterium]